MSKDSEYAAFVQRCYNKGLDEKQILRLQEYMDDQKRITDELCEKWKTLVFPEDSEHETEDEQSDGESDFEGDEDDEFVEYD